jgi:hypothetical protein
MPANTLPLLYGGASPYDYPALLNLVMQAQRAIHAASQPAARPNWFRQLWQNIPQEAKLAGLGALIGLVFPNAFAEPGSGYRRLLMTQMLEALQRQDRTGRTLMQALARLPATPSFYWGAQQQAHAQAVRAGQAATRNLPAGVQLPGLAQRVESSVYAQLSQPLQNLLAGESRDAYQRALQQLQLLNAVGGQSRDLASSYGYLAQLYSQMGNNWTGLLPQLLQGLILSSMQRSR